MIDPEKIDDPKTHVIRVHREHVRDGLPQQIGTPLAEIRLPDQLAMKDLADAISAGDAVPMN